MAFNGFSREDFEVFQIEGLDERMEGIRERIQPKFKAIGETLVDDMAMLVGNDMYLHIAKHARRTKNPPQDTWLAIANYKRGYKKIPHFQIGLFDDHLFIWLAYIYELPNKEEIATKFLQNIDQIQALPEDYVVSLDHTQKEAFAVKDEEALRKGLERFRDVKKGEFLIGRQINADNPVLQDGSKFLDLARQTFETLVPLYHLPSKEVS